MVIPKPRCFFVVFETLLKLLADQHCLIHCRTTEPVLGQDMGQLWYWPKAGLNPPRCLEFCLQLFEKLEQIYLDVCGFAYSYIQDILSISPGHGQNYSRWLISGGRILDFVKALLPASHS